MIGWGCLRIRDKAAVNESSGAMRAHKETTCITKALVKPQNSVGWHHAHDVDPLVVGQLARRRAGEWKPQPSK